MSAWNSIIYFFYLQVISPKDKLEVYFIEEVVKSLNELVDASTTRRINIQEITENIRDILIAASVKEKQLFIEVIHSIIGIPYKLLIEDIVRDVYKSDEVEAIITKLNNGIPEDFQKLIPYIKYTAKVLSEIVEQFILPY